MKNCFKNDFSPSYAFDLRCTHQQLLAMEQTLGRSPFWSFDRRNFCHPRIPFWWNIFAADWNHQVLQYPIKITWKMCLNNFFGITHRFAVILNAGIRRARWIFKIFCAVNLTATFILSSSSILASTFTLVNFWMILKKWKFEVKFLTIIDKKCWI